MSPRLRAAIALGGVFVLGIATGAGGMRMFHARRMTHLLEGPTSVARRHVVMAALDRQLDLSRDQHAKIDAILEKHEPELATVTQSIEPKLEPIFASIEGEIRGELTDEQRPKFEEVSKRFHERRHVHLAP